jgi:hypothetical protein
MMPTGHDTSGLNRAASGIVPLHSFDMGEQSTNHLLRFWGRPRRFFAWATLVSTLCAFGWSYLLDRIKHGEYLNEMWALTVFSVFVLGFIISVLGLILSLVPYTRPGASWILQRWFFCLAVLVTLIALFYAEENWRGQRALDRAKRELADKGVVLDWDKFIPPPVPDEQNVFKAPKMEEWFVGRGSPELIRIMQSQTNFPVWGDGRRKIETEAEAHAYLNWSEEFQPQFAMIRDALKRPYLRIEADYSQPLNMPIPNFVAIRHVARVLAQRTHCFLLLHEPEKAVADLAFLNELRHFTECRPSGNPMTLVGAMINVSVAGIYTGVIGEGLQTHAFPEQQLIELQKQLAEIHLMDPVATAVKTEPAATTYSLETTPFHQVIHAFGTHSFLVIAPRGWILQNIANDLSFYYVRTEAFDVQHETIKPGVLKDSQKRLEEFIQHKSPFRIFAAVMIPNMNKAARAAAHGQTSVNEALTACALERYRTAHGSYPVSLDALLPTYFDKIPHDVITGESLKYHRTDTSVVLYSIGWNETDDGGTTPPTIENGQPDLNNGDWVWQYSPK